MAGRKSSRKKDDATKKRKRDVKEDETNAKRHRQRGRESEANGDETNGKKNSDEFGDAVNGSKDLVKADVDEIILNGEHAESGWKVSKPMGGRMLDIDPILTQDEDHLILAYNTSVQVYGTSDSLLVRRIAISTLDSSAPQGTTPSHVVATRLSKTDSEYVWVATSDGRIHRARWTTSEPPVEAFQTSSKSAKAMVVVPASDGDVLLMAESEKASRMELVAYKADDAGNFHSKSLLTLKKPDTGLHILESSHDGQLLVGAFQDRLFLGTAPSSWDDLENLQVDFFSFDSPDIITCLDIRSQAKFSTGEQSVDIVVGGARGGIYMYNDALSRVRAAGKPQFLKDGIQVQKYHWHRRAVHAVKWSHDGNYFISGGSENVLVSWQIDTSKKDFLPHLSGSVENIVVSPTGSSYVVHLDDNSAMILTTAELKPTAYVAGIQSAAIDVATPKDQLVRRLWNSPGQVKKPIPAAIRPTDPRKLHVCVGNGCQATMSGDLSAPLLQSFDLESFTSSSKHALARTQPTDVNITNKGHIIDEPLVRHIAFSGDGRWLASVDEWQPAARDVENVSGDLKDQFLRERHEVYLKFWDMQGGADTVTLVSRVNSPHATTCPESVLDLAADASSSAFATVGGDAAVRIWRPRLRQQHGVAVKDTNGLDAVSWSCTDLIEVGDGAIQNSGTDLLSPLNPNDTQGSVSFSDDGSTLFAAFGTYDAGAVYVIDVASGEVVKTLEGLWDGKLQSIRTLGPYIITLSDDLRVYDVVSDELRYGIVVPKVGRNRNDLLQLEVDHMSGHFAVTLPIGGISSIGVFDPEVPQPLLVRSTPHRIVSLVSAPTTSGFIAVDDAAQVWVISEASELSSLAAAQPLQDMKLDRPNEAEIVTSNGESEILENDVDMASEDEAGDAEEDRDVEMGDDSDDDDDVHARVITQQAFTEIFDAAPSFAAPSIEDLFYKVTGLLATKPLSAS